MNSHDWNGHSEKLKKAKRYKAIGGKQKTLLKSDVLMSYEP
jgi:hypothetical protein